VIMPSTRDEENQESQPLLPKSHLSANSDETTGSSIRPTSLIAGHVDEEARPGSTSTTGAMFSIVTTAVGVGVLALPSAMAKAGWIGGCFSLAVAAVFACQCGKMLIRATELAEEHTGLALFRMEDIMEACTGSATLKTMVSWIFLFTLSAIGAVMLILIGTNLEYINHDFLNQRGWLLVGFLILIPLGWLREVKYIANLAFLGVFASLATGLLIVIASGNAIFNEGPSFGHGHATPNDSDIPDSSSNVLPASALDVAGTYCIFVFSFTYSMVCPSLRQDMVRPAEIHKAIDRACGLMTLIYASVATFGYAAWGRLVNDNVITSMSWCSADPNGHEPAGIKKAASWACYVSDACAKLHMQSDSATCSAHGMCEWREGKCQQKAFSHQSVYGLIIAVLVVVNCLITYLLILAPVFKNLEGSNASSAIWKPSLMRTGVMLATFIFALSVPFFLQVVGVISALTLVALQMFTPVIMIQGMNRKKRTVDVRQMIWHATILICGGLAMVLGLYSAINDLSEEIKQNPETMKEMKDFFTIHFWTEAKPKK